MPFIYYEKVSKKNIREIITRLLALVEKSEGVFRDDLVVKIIELCHQDQYANINDFEWYLGILSLLSRVQVLAACFSKSNTSGN